MFKDRKEFEEALIKSVEALEKHVKDMENHIDSAVGANPAHSGISVEHGYHKADGGTSMIDYQRNAKGEKHVKEHVVPYLKAKGYEVEHNPKYDADSGRVYVNRKQQSVAKADMGRGGRPKDVGMFTSEHMNHVVKLKDHGEAKKYAHGVVDASAARPENKDKARKMINSSKHPVHLGSGMANFALAAEGLGVNKMDAAPPPPPSPSGGEGFSPAMDSTPMAGTNAIAKAEDTLHPRHLGSVDNAGGKVHVFSSSAPHHRHLPGLHHEVAGASSMGSDSSKWHPSVHEAIGRAKTGGFPRVVLHEPAKKQVYNQSNMKVAKEDSSLTSGSADVPQAGRITKTELLKTYLENLKEKLIKANGHLGEYWKQPLNIPKPSKVPRAEKIVYNADRKPKAPIRTALEAINTPAQSVGKAERKIIRPKSDDKPAVKSGLQPSKVTMHTGKVRYAPMGTSDRPRDHAAYSEHVILHDNKPIGLATVHHSHPSDHGKITNKLGGAHEHSVEVHAPSIHQDDHGMLRAKVREHVNSKDFKRQVDKHNEDKHDYKRPKFWLDDKKKKKE